MMSRPLSPIPDRTVLLTFDDGNRSDLITAAPILRRHGFGATFFITEGLGVLTGDDGGSYLSWDDVRDLHDQGFEIGNHTKDHLGLTAPMSDDEFAEQFSHIQERCREHGIPEPISFCYPGFAHNRRGFDAVERAGFRFARRGVSPEYPDGGSGGRGPAYDPHEDHPLLIPTTGYAGPEWTLDDLVWAVDQARDGLIASVVFHGVPGPQHPWVSASPETFADYMDYLAEAGCTVISMRQLEEYVDPAWATAPDPYAAIERRLAAAR
jgi:peptidoglycan/xylan/chitin deacetylase (PgdA/CDA1 family)